jgi:hypothetical protein
MLFACCWGIFLLIYGCIGVGALVLVFLIEAQFFLQITYNPILSYVVAGILESAKVGTSVIKQALAIAKKVLRIRISPLLQGLTALFQLALIVLSLICSVMVVTSYLDGTYARTPEPVSKDISRMPQRSLQSNSSPHQMVIAAVQLLRESLGIEVKSSVCVSIFALLMSALFQSTMYIVFGHILATQATEIEHIFLVKLQKLEVKKITR